MWKYVGVAGGVFLFAQAFAMGGRLYEGVAGETSTGPRQSVEERLAYSVEQQNKKRGQRVDGGVFSGATRYGKTVVFEFTLDKAPTRYDAGKAHDRLLKQMIPRFCTRKFDPELRAGAAVVFRYVSKSGLTLVDAKVDAGVCELAT
jgi:hypothetical protein